MACCLGCAVCLFAALNQPSGIRWWREVPSATLAGALFLCGPELSLFFSSRPQLSDNLLTLSLVPVVAVVTLATRSSGDGLRTGWLLAALMGTAGLLLILPEPRVVRVEDAVLFALQPILTGIGAVTLCVVRLPSRPLGAACAFAGAAAVFGAGTLLPSAVQLPFHWPACILDSSVISMAILAAWRVGPMRYSARFLVVPLLSLLFGLAVLRPELNVRSILGLGLLAGGSIALLRVGTVSQEDESVFFDS